MFYLIGLGLNEKSLTLEAQEACKEADVWLESYTASLPYSAKKLEEQLGKSVKIAGRDDVESEKVLKEAGKKDIALLVYGSPLAATTHTSLILACKKAGIKYKTIENCGIFEAIAETGLQLYKFGKTASLPCWKPGYNPVSFMEIIKENQKIKAHTLLLVDPELSLEKALEELEAVGVKEKLILAEGLGTAAAKIYWNDIENLKKVKITRLFCFIIPSELHFAEKEFLASEREKI